MMGESKYTLILKHALLQMRTLRGTHACWGLPETKLIYLCVLLAGFNRRRQALINR